MRFVCYARFAVLLHEALGHLLALLYFNAARDRGSSSNKPPALPPAFDFMLYQTYYKLQLNFALLLFLDIVLALAIPLFLIL